MSIALFEIDWCVSSWRPQYAFVTTTAVGWAKPTAQPNMCCWASLRSAQPTVLNSIYIGTTNIKMKEMKNNGFTLIEILVALAIFAITASIVAVGLNSLLGSYQHVNQKAETIAQLQIAMSLLEKDINQAIDRPITNEAGTVEPAVVSVGDDRLQLTRSGNINPVDTTAQSDMLRVSYQLDHGNLQRWVWPVLDRTPQNRPVQQNLLHDVASFQWRFLTNQNKFVRQWPSDQEDSRGAHLPKAIELQLAFNNGEKLSRIIAINASNFIDAASD